MFSTFLCAQHHRLEQMAEGWLLAGARAFSVWDPHDTLLACWPAVDLKIAADEAPSLSVPILVNAKRVGQLRLHGLDGAVANAHLTAQAALIAQLYTLEHDLASMTEALVETQDRLLALYEVAHSVSGQLELSPMLQTLATQAARLVGVQGAYITLEQGADSLTHAYPFDLPAQDDLKILTQHVRTNGQDLLFNSASALSLGIHNLFVTPVPVRGQLGAALALCNKPRGDIAAPDIKLAHAMAQEAGVHIERVLLYQETLEKARLKTELDLAASIQTRLLPRSVPSVKKLAICARSLSARQVGGDFYEFVYQPDTDLLTFVVGDVSGKGVSSALLMAMTRTALLSRAKVSPSPGAAKILALTNSDLYDDFTDVSMFVTLFIGQYDEVNSRLTYANAGHSPVIYCPVGGAVRLLQAEDLPLGVLETCDYSASTVTLHPGDVLVVASDGFSEAQDATGALFGSDHLLNLVEQNAALTADEICAALFVAIDDFSRGHPQDDDQTLLIIKVLEK